MNNFFSKKSQNMIFQEISDQFNSTSLITRNCIKSINSFLYFLNTKEMDQDTLNSILIFLLKAFQSKEQYLKNVVYSCVTEVSKYTDQGFIGINIIIKDYMDSKYKHRILKSLFCIIPEEMLYDFIKILKEAFVSNNDILINSAVLVSYNLVNKNYIKVKDLFGTLKITDDVHGYHALALMNLSNKDNRSNIYKNEAGIMSVRLATKYKKFDLFKTFLNARISDSCVFFEACKQMAEMKEEYSIQYVSMICQGLRNYLKSTNFYEKFASIKILSKLSLKFPKKVEVLNKDIEELLQDSSKSLSMFAISTLLKTGTESTIDRLIKYLPEFMSEMDDNYKKIGLNALLILTTKNKSRADVFIDFVRNCFLDKGNLGFKLYIVDLLKNIIENKSNLCDGSLLDRILDIYINYLEDSEYYEVSSEILGILSRQICKSKNFKKYVLHIYNRLILEDSKLKTSALQCIYDLSSQTYINEAVFQDCDDEIYNKFYLNNLKNKISNEEIDFDLNSLGDLQDKVLNYFSKYSLEEKKEEEIIEQVKECREILLNKETDEILIKLIKKISGDKIILEYKIENKHDDIEIKNGVLSVKVKDEVKRLEFSNLLPSKSIKLDCEINKESDITIYGNLDYELCMVDDYNEVDIESMSLNPYQITLFDLMMNFEKEKGAISRLIKFNLKLDLVGGSKKILDLLNLKIINQNNVKNCNNIILSGDYEGSSCYIECNIEYEKICRCNIEIWCDDEKLLERLVKYFD
jgi:coatomer subunit gamma